MPNCRYSQGVKLRKASFVIYLFVIVCYDALVAYLATGTRQLERLPFKVAVYNFQVTSSE